MKSDLILLIFINLGICSYGQLDLGFSCIVERTKFNGICKLLDECPSAIDDIKHKVFEHTRCGFAGLKEIICCPETPTTPATLSVENTISRISQKKCKEYSSIVFEEVLSPLLIGGPQKKVSVDKCRHKTIPIIGSNELMPKEFPHMALIGFDSSDNEEIEWFCSGTLISDEYVLTAAHCTYSREYGEAKYVRLGELNLDNEDNSSSEDFNISAIIIHPEYKRSSYYNDIALLKLNRKAELNSYKRPACLPTTFDFDGNKAISTGRIRNLLSRNSPSRLTKRVLDIFTSSECNATYSEYLNRKLKQGIIADTQICAGLRHEVKDDGPGDSGGPLQIYHPDQYCMYTIIGVSSFGILASNPTKFPDVFTRVYHYLDWIEHIVWANYS